MIRLFIAELCLRICRYRTLPGAPNISWPGSTTGGPYVPYPLDNDNLCPPGKYLGENETCLNCAPGYHQMAEGRTLCDPCTVGLFQQSEGETKCLTCNLFDNGQAYQDRPNATSCIRCPSGTQRRPGSNGSAVTDCLCVCLALSLLSQQHVLSIGLPVIGAP